MVTGNDGEGGYRAVLRLPGWWTWATVAVFSRSPMAMAPLALVLLGHAAYGSFAVGGLLSAANAFAEAVAGPILGARLDRRGSEWELKVGLAVQGALYALVAVTAGRVPSAGLIMLVAAAGAAGAGVPGSLRSTIVAISPQRLVQRVLSIDTVLLELCWTTGPPIVAGLITLAGAPAGLLAMAGCSWVALIGTRWLPKPRKSPGDGPTIGQSLTGLRHGLWTLAFALIGGLAGGVLDTAVPPKLASINAPAQLAGVLFAGYSLASMIGGLLYGHRRWPGTPHRQASLLLFCLVTTLSAGALTHRLPIVVLSVTLSGFFAAPQLAARSLALQEDLRPGNLSAGFASLNTTNAAGYGLAALAVGFLLHNGTTLAFAVPLAVCLGCVLLAVSTAQAPNTRNDAAVPEPTADEIRKPAQHHDE